MDQRKQEKSPLAVDPLWTNNFVKIWIFNLLLCVWFFMLSAPFPFYIIELGGTELLVGIIAGGFAIAALIVRPIAGWILDNSSRKGLLVWGVLSLILLTVLLFAIPVLAVVVILRILSGLMFAGTGTASTTNVYDTITPRRFAEGIGFLGLGNTLAMALAPALGLAIVAGWGFNILFAISAAVLLIAFTVMKGFSFKKIEKPKKTQEQKGFFRSKLINVDALPASVVMLFTSVPYGGASIFIALYAEAYSLGNAGLFFTLFAVGTGSTRLISGRIADKKGEQPMIIIGNSLLMVSLALLLAANTYSYYAAGLLFGIGSGIILPAMQAMSMRVIPIEKRGSASSTYLCSYDIASGAGGILAGWIVTVWGYRPMFVSLGIFLVISMLIYALWASKTPSAFKVYQRNKKQEAC